MGFGLLMLGYLSILGNLPSSFVYYNFFIFIPITGGLIMLAAFSKLQGYNIKVRWKKESL